MDTDKFKIEDYDVAFHLPNAFSSEQLCVRMSLKELCQRITELHPAIFIGPNTIWEAIGNVLLHDVAGSPKEYINERVQRTTLASEVARRITDLRVIMGSMGVDEQTLNFLIREVARQGAFGKD